MSDGISQSKQLSWLAEESKDLLLMYDGVKPCKEKFCRKGFELWLSYYNKTPDDIRVELKRKRILR